MRRRRRRISLKSRLVALRAGLLSFPEFVEETHQAWERLAGYFIARWPGQVVVDEEDLYQEILIAVWASVQSWDPTRGVAIDRYVTYQAGVAATVAMKRVLHYTRKRGAVWSLPLPRGDPSDVEKQSRVLAVQEFLESARGRGLEEEVASGLVDGRDLKDVAEALYRDAGSRWRFWFGSEAEARSRVLSVARRMRSRERTA